MRWMIAVAATCLLLASCGDEESPPAAAQALVEIGGTTVRADVAADEASRARGLSGRPGLADDEGMLFLLSDDSPSFWMKGMRFPLDIIWIRDGRVVDVSADVPPPRGSGAPLPTYSPGRPATRALEVNAGWAADHGIRRGDVVRVRRGSASR
jgi:uncharacterized membrane protein (UPF0127 family)